MKNITVLGYCPAWVETKARNIINEPSKMKVNSKKLAGLKSHYSVKLNQHYRLLFSDLSQIYLCGHNHYEKKIKNLKKVGE
ncbi:ParE family toxin-like protein [Alteromonas lipolytica]|uniref:ParE-like toxin domain-containing protein n=1 Tax=Alteromonas lipolytica TaxID=1856405 RepID=A0A1E8FDA0_9ALTE|nr:hypothetical protein [Alteromonas lipolytica]OFI33917.1 hypothetical protein BFC17_20345 [Alteromonas lipolytica]GGF67298.1 hypothetical protein GCM10011338_19300 [Alteromonas lipolytica]